MIYQASSGDFIYIVIGILWILFSIYNANRKKVKKQTDKQAIDNKKGKSSPSFLDSLINEIEMKQGKNVSFSNHQKNEHKEATTTNVLTSENETNKIFSYDDYYEEGNFEKENDVLIEERREIRTNNKAKSELLSLNKTKNTKRKVKSIDLRKAVIYSEILNAKYF